MRRLFGYAFDEDRDALLAAELSGIGAALDAAEAPRVLGAKDASIARALQSLAREKGVGAATL